MPIRKYTWAVAAYAAILVPTFASECDAGANWTQFQGDAAHTGYIDSNVYPAAMELRWWVTAKSMGVDAFVPGVASNQDSTFLTGAKWLGSPSRADYTIISRSNLDGALQWAHTYDSYVPEGITAPSLLNDTVVAYRYGTGTSADPRENSYLIGLAEADGAERFYKYQDGQFPSGNRPTTVDTSIYMQGGYFGGMYSYQQGGETEWFTQLNPQYNWIPTVDDERAYVYMGPASASPGPAVGTLFGLNRTTGVVDFTILDTDAVNMFFDNTLFITPNSRGLVLTYGSQGVTLTCFDLDAGEVAWRRQGDYRESFGLLDGLIYAPDFRELHVLNEEDGSLLASWQVPGDEYIRSNIVVTNLAIFVGTNEATYAIDRDTLATLWSRKITGTLSVSADMLFVSNEEGVYAFAVPEPSSIGILLGLVTTTAGAMIVRKSRRSD